MKYTCLIVDDEPLAHVVMEEYIQKIAVFELKGNCYDALDAFNFLQRHPIDILFLDINMPEISGLNLLATLKESPLVVLTTAYSEFALDSYEYEVIDYLLKPIRFERFLKTVQKIMTQKQKVQKIASGGEKKNFLMAKTDAGVVKTDVKEIRYIEAYGNFIKIHVQGKYILTAEKMQQIQDQLENIIRVHKSYLINLQYLEKIEGNRIILKDQTEIPMGNSYKQSVLDKLK